ncbi:MAG: hypothetical protein SFT92_09890 [Rickettsiales bacterium]|nr:hypothetical protein [Rickettsiales bacterium]
MSIEDKKAKKKAQRAKNRKTFEMMQAFRQLNEEAERVRDDERERVEKKRDDDKQEEEVWSAKVASIRNRLTDQRRNSKERWNRFAGTGGEGGRGL